MEIFGFDDWLAWFLLGIGLLIVEVVIGFTFYAAPIALGAFAATIVAAFGDAIEPQLIAFILGSLASLIALRPLVRQHLQPPEPEKRSNVQRMLGARAVALERIDVDSGMARVGEEVWSARTESEDLVIEPGERVEVAAVRGVYAYVRPHQPPPEGQGDPDEQARGPAAAGEEES
jgi:membrane protein implicated in regulation of membrane protease activity